MKSTLYIAAMSFMLVGTHGFTIPQFGQIKKTKITSAIPAKAAEKTAPKKDAPKKGTPFPKPAVKPADKKAPIPGKK